MIIHSTFTNGYFEFSKLFLRSFKQSNGEEFKIVFTTSDLKIDEIQKLKEIYKNLTIYNKKFDYSNICKELDMTEKQVKQLKYESEHIGAPSNTLRPKWKMHIAAENRVKIDIPFVMKKYESEGLIAHFDIDMYFKGSLKPLFKIMEEHDFTVMYRPHMKKKWRKIWMCVMGIKTNNRHTADFIKSWGKELDKIPLRNKPFALWQTSCYKVYRRFMENTNIKFGNIPESYILTGKTGSENTLIISGNKASIGKDVCLNRFKMDFYKRSLS